MWRPGVFQGQKRKTHLAVQGRFKQELEFSELLTGQEFARPLKRLPATALFSVLLRFAKKLSPSMIAGITPIPHILTPVVAGSQVGCACGTFLRFCCVVKRNSISTKEELGVHQTPHPKKVENVTPCATLG